MNFHSDEDVRADDNIREERQEYIQSQYSYSPRICQILYDFRDNIKPDADIELFLKNVMQLETAVGEGLNILGNIIGISRMVTFKNEIYSLDDEGYRLLLKYKALANITDTSLDTLNRMMCVLFPDLNLQVFNIIRTATNGDENYNSYPMHVRWYLERDMDEVDKAIFAAGGTLCLSAGVGWELLAIPVDTVFGFENSGLQNFNNGVFWDYKENVITEAD